jgi:hypothetical protein
VLQENIIRTFRTLRKFGFVIKVDPVAMTHSLGNRQLCAVQAAAALLYNVDVEAFDEGGNWAVVKNYVLENGFARIREGERRVHGFGLIGAAAINAALELAALILENTQAN